MPASVFAWQRGWRFSKLMGFTFGAYAVHVILGALVFGALSGILSWIPESMLGAFTIIFLGAVGTVRIFRFNRIREILYRNKDQRRVLLTLLSLLGPSEMAVPIFMKAKLDGVPMAPIFGAFAAGTWLAGLMAVTISRALWNRPLMLPRAVQWYQSSVARVAILPVSVGTVVGIVLISLRVM